MSNALISTIVVDDEPLACKRLVRLLRKDPEISLVATCSAPAEALREILKLAPQLILLDIRMPEMDGFELLAALAENGIQPYIIFVTAYSERAVEAFGVSAIDYLVKPFDDERFARALVRAKSLIGTERGRSAGGSSQPTRTPLAGGPARLLFSERGKVVVLAPRDIEFVRAAAKYVKIYVGGRCLVFRQSLKKLEDRLDPACFARVHRSTLVNLEQIVEIHPLFHGDYELILKGGIRLTLSRRYRERLGRFLGQ